MKEAQSETNNSISHSIELKCQLERNSFPHQKVGELYGMLQIHTKSSSPTFTLNPALQTIHNSSSPSVDFVFVIDVSSSMKEQNKLAHVQGAVEYVITRLIQDSLERNSPPHRFCLIQFSDYAEIVTDGFVNLTPQNRESLLASLRTLRPGGSTNISEALFCALEVISNSFERNQFISEGNETNSPLRGALANIMLLTDGLANSGMRGTEFTEKVRSLGVPQQIAINTFGFGNEHDSESLKAIALASSGGVYYYVPQPTGILSAFAEAISGALHVRSHEIMIHAVAHDGCRIVEWFSPLPIQTNKSCKDYLFTVGTSRELETRTILFKISLRNMANEMENHPLLTFRATLINSITGASETYQITASVSRPDPPLSNSPTFLLKEKVERRPFELDEQINRWTTATAIQRAADLMKESAELLGNAQQTIVSVLSQIAESSSSESKFCHQLEADLKRCGSALGTYSTVTELGQFSPAMHLCHAISTMHFVERSSGTRTCLSTRRIFGAHFSLSNSFEEKNGSGSSINGLSAAVSPISWGSGTFSLHGSNESSESDLSSAVWRLDANLRSFSELNKRFNLRGDQSEYFFSSLGSLTEASETDRYFVSYQREEVALARAQASKYYEHYLRRLPLSKTALAAVSSGSFSDSSTEICRKRSASGAPIRRKLSCSQEEIKLATSTTNDPSTSDFVSSPSINAGITT